MGTRRSGPPADRPARLSAIRTPQRAVRSCARSPGCPGRQLRGPPRAAVASHRFTTSSAATRPSHASRMRIVNGTSSSRDTSAHTIGRWVRGSSAHLTDPGSRGLSLRSSHSSRRTPSGFAVRRNQPSSARPFAEPPGRPGSWSRHSAGPGRSMVEPVCRSAWSTCLINSLAATVPHPFAASTSTDDDRPGTCPGSAWPRRRRHRSGHHPRASSPSDTR